jgi:sugar lactone lactonase YvrE
VFAIVLAILILLLGLSGYLLYGALHVPTTVATGDKPVETRGIIWVRSIYGTSNNLQDLFGQTQVAVPSSDGTIWVTDVTHQSTIMRFNPDGQFLGLFKSLDASAPISAPSRIAIGPDQRVYICETALDQILVLKPNGELSQKISVPQPVSVAVSQDRIAVGSVSGFAVLDMNGKPIGVIGTRGKGPDQFDYVHGIAFGPDGAIFVTDSYNNRIRAYEPDGKPRWTIRTGAASNSAALSNNMLSSTPTSDTVLKGSDALQLPLGLTVDGAGRVVVVDMYDCSLAVFNPKTGKLIAKYGEVGAEDGQFFYPVSVGYDPGRDWFTVADALNRRVEIVRIPGSSAGAASTTASVSRALASPLRACLFPLLILLLAIVTYIVVRFVRRRRPAKQPTDPGSDDEPAFDTGSE